jgi:hypothetical protein
VNPLSSSAEVNFTEGVNLYTDTADCHGFSNKMPLDQSMDAWSPYASVAPAIIADYNHEDWNPSMVMELQDLIGGNPWLGNNVDPCGETILPTDNASSYASNTTATLSQDIPPKHSVKNPVKGQKLRLKCPRCNSTFPRKYELARHERNVHNRSFTLLCPVYGCSRTTNPFGRPDKFREHMRKHRQSGKFLCIIEDCRKGPFTQTELEDHLNSCHREKSNQPYLEVVLKALNLRATEFEDGLSLFEDVRSCPLAFLGCSFIGEDISKHLTTHELVDRSRGYIAIKSIQKEWSWGTVTCPMCT